MAYSVTLIPGDGVGPEVTWATRKVLEATGVEFEWEVQQVGAEALKLWGTPLPEPVLQSIRRNRVALKGPVTTPVGTGFRSVNVALRQKLDLYACLRPCRSFPGVPSRFEKVDLVVVRENTEDLYAGIEFERGTPEALKLMEFIAALEGKKLDPGSGFSIKPISDRATRRIAQFAFRYARESGRRKVSVVHKANIMKFTDGLFLEVAREVAKEYPEIEFEDVIVDNLCMQLVRRPERFDVLLLPNLYGDIVSDLCAGLIGGLGLAPSANLGDEAAIFEPAHGSAPKYAGKNRVNPVAMMLSGGLLLRYLGEREAAERLERAIAQVLTEGSKVTYDLKPDPNDPTAATTSEMTEEVIRKLREV